MTCLIQVFKQIGFFLWSLTFLLICLFLSFSFPYVIVKMSKSNISTEFSTWHHPPWTQLSVKYIRVSHFGQSFRYLMSGDIVNKHIKKCFKNLVIRELQIKTTRRYQCTPTWVNKISKDDDTLTWLGCGTACRVLNCYKSFGKLIVISAQFGHMYIPTP